MPVRNYTDLLACQKAMVFVEMVYKVTAGFPREEQYGLTSQLRRAAVSVPSNIAEGQGRHSDREFHRFLCIAHGSLREAETQILIAKRLGYIGEHAQSQLMELATEAGRLTNGLLSKLSRDA